MSRRKGKVTPKLIATATSDNLDISIASLAAEIRDNYDHYKGARVEMGHKILAVRELLRQKYGTAVRGKLDPAGFRAPIGWGQWVVENLKISASHAAIYMNFAVDPEGMRLRTNAIQHRQRRVLHAYALGCCRRAWPHLPEIERERLVAGLLALREGNQ